MIVIREVELAFGDRRVLRGCDLVIKPGDRVGLVGANGCGKSTLLKCVAGELQQDHGTVSVTGRVSALSQEPVLHGHSVGDCAAAAIAWHSKLLDDYSQALEDEDFDLSAELQDRLDHVGWEAEHRVDGMLDRLGAPPVDAEISLLSGGERRRVALALALLGQPDILLLDEPTNHLDLDAVEWLQGWLSAFRGALVLVTHDRYLLEAVIERIVEVERGRCVSYDGSYGDYLVARAERQARLENAQDRRLQMIKREAEWASRSPAARSTKQKARLDRLDALKNTERIEFNRGFDLDLSSGDRRSGVVIEVIGAKKAYDGRELLHGFDLSLSPGERIGILGPNGSGKSTLLRVLTGDVTPDSGELVKASRTHIALLDQHRTGLEAPDGSDWSVVEAAGGGSGHVVLAGKQAASWQGGVGGRAAKTMSVPAFLDRFLFARESLDQPVSKLSGGERARLLLAKLLLRGSTVLLLDEPTNDLDLLTLRVLEEALLSFDGAVVVVTHDRAFLDRVCTGVIYFGEDGPVRYASRSQIPRRRSDASAKQPGADKALKKTKPKAKKKLSYNEQREFDRLPDAIEEAEMAHAALAEKLGDPELYKKPPQQLSALRDEIAAAELRIEALYTRWGELEGRQ